jgi:hypothetical protein
MLINFHVPITIKTLRILNLLLLLSKTSLSLAKKIDHQTWPNILPNITFQTLHNVFKRRSMEASLGCHFLITKIIGLTISSAFHVVLTTTSNHYLCIWQRPKHGRVSLWQTWQNMFNHHRIWERW